MNAEERRKLLLSLSALALLVIIAIAAPFLVSVHPNEIPSSGIIASLPPSIEHPFGTDPSGRDVLSRIIYGSRVSLGIAFLSVILSSTVGLLYGSLSAWSGGWIDTAAMRLLDVAMSVPRILIVLCIAALWGSLPLTSLVLLLGLTGWYDTARLVRGEVISLQTRDFILAARATGVKESRILFRHIVPHLWPVLAVSAPMGLAHTLILEAGLSYLGLGVQPPQASWGAILSDGSGTAAASWWLTVFPGLAILFAVLSSNVLSESLRSWFNPFGRQA